MSSAVFKGTIFSIPSSLHFDPVVEQRKEELRRERELLQAQLDMEGFSFQGNDSIPYVSNSDPIRRAVEKAAERLLK